MKYFTMLLSIFLVQTVEAQMCAATSKEMAQHSKQANWRQYTLSGPQGVPPIHGFIDEQNNFYFNDLTRSGAIEASIQIEASNSYFFKYCRAGKASYLRSMRRSNEKNSYKVKMQYLPSFSSFANNPLATQNYKEDEYRIRLKFDSSSSFDTQENYPDRLKNELVVLLNKQAREQKTMGVIELDLTNWDDVACDLIQGRMSIWLNREGLSDMPLIEMKKEIDPADLSITYKALQQQVSPSFEKEKAIFVASRTIAKLENDRQIGNWAEKKGFDILKKFMNPEMSRLLEMDSDAVSCLASQMQSYNYKSNHNIINVQFKLPTLDQLEGR